MFGYWFKLFCVQSVVSPDSTDGHFDLHHSRFTTNYTTYTILNSHHSRFTSFSIHIILILFYHFLLISVPGYHQCS